MEPLKTKIYSPAYYLEGDYVDDSKGILDEILKDNDCEVPSDDNEVVECIETEKRYRTSFMNKVKICNFVFFENGN